ncbi:MAG: peptidyl-prolyl cis-trans isomerase [Pseudomonadales bacterium]|nr:peptidyl-prolyl cis-trans isomerase [Pseudomonadales bacterium]MBO6596974.1 peptidyl-prolyl cis-trans isomerase [Pseudomonadales bacterium]MBO6657927.1 peptidyl-prolyl cis-trans isomerase [Pseudomonadales bacterium]MBO7004327.1 peptidyl-prolyl cis-trans isomerase [Pseudomonadales bacterium]
MSLFKQPLLHFLVLGALLFVVFELTVGSGAESDQTIVVDRERLLEFMQFRSKSFDAERFDSILENMPEDRRQQLIDDYVREETLYREAVALGLEVNDYIIRQRLVQKVEYLARGFDAATNVDAVAYYERNLDRYVVPATATFTHVFVSYDNHPTRDQARAVADAIRDELVAKDVSFSGALSYGERFAFHKNYVDRSQAFIASHFGEAFAAQLFSLALNEWSEPVASAYGLHMVLISKRGEERTAPFEEVAQNARFDAEQEAVREQTEQSIKEIISRYNVVVEL